MGGKSDESVNRMFALADSSVLNMIRRTDINFLLCFGRCGNRIFGS